jgi:hypothetical protein
MTAKVCFIAIIILLGLAYTRGLSPGFVSPAGAQTQRPGGLNQIAQPLALVGSPVGDLPISPAPNGWCYTAGIS